MAVRSARRGAFLRADSWFVSHFSQIVSLCDAAQEAEPEPEPALDAVMEDVYDGDMHGES